MNVENKVAIVTGGTKGIGRAIADALLREGVSVCVSARNVETIGDGAQQERYGTGGREIMFPCDVRAYDHVKALVSYTVKEFGGLDILVNNAGIGIFETVEQTSPE